MREEIGLSAVGAAAAFGAVGAVLALIGVGVPFIVAAAALSLCVGVVLQAVQRKRIDGRASQVAALRAQAEEAALRAQEHEAALHARVAQLEAMASALRHDVRGVLSPALMVTDRLVNHTDPAIRRAGEAVVRSVDRASALLAASKDV